METIDLGSSGLRVSRVGIGCNNFGSRIDFEHTRAVVDAALEAGITFFDTAEVYGGGGGSERMLGELLEGRREQVVLATKFGWERDRGRGGAELVRESLQGSLERLRTDYVDLYYLHKPDPETPISETLTALDELVREGKVRALGCDHPIVYTRERFAERVREITSGVGVPVVYDSVGRDTFLDSLACLRKRGVMVSFGNSTGPVAPFECALLARLGSLYVTRPTLFDYIDSRAELLARAAELFEIVAAGKVKIEIGQRYPLRDAAEAHRVLQARRTTGSTVLLP